MPPSAKEPEFVPLPSDATEVDLPDLRLLKKETFDEIFNRMPQRTREQRHKMTREEGHREVEKYVKLLFKQCNVNLDELPRFHRARVVFNDVVAILLHQKIYTVTTYSNWSGLRLLRQSVMKMIVTRREYNVETMAPFKQVVGWTYLHYIRKIRGSTDLVTENYEHLRLVEKMPTALKAAIRGIQDKDVFIIRNYPTSANWTLRHTPENEQTADQFVIKLENLDEQNYAGTPNPNLPLTISLAETHMRTTPRPIVEPPEMVEVPIVKTWTRDEVETAYRDVFDKVFKINEDQHALTPIICSLKPCHIKVLSPERKNLLFFFARMHGLEEIKQMIEPTKDEDLAIWDEHTVTKHVNQDNWTEKPIKKLSAYVGSLARIEPGNEMCKTLARVSKMIHDWACQWEELVKEQVAPRHSELSKETIEQLLALRTLFDAAAPWLTDAFDRILYKIDDTHLSSTLADRRDQEKRDTTPAFDPNISVDRQIINLDRPKFPTKWPWKPTNLAWRKARRASLRRGTRMARNLRSPGGWRKRNILSKPCP